MTNTIFQVSGWWEQADMGRQAMELLEIEISGENIRGRGVDIVGSFTFIGMIQRDGIVHIVQQYVGKHQVIYPGSYELGSDSSSK